MRTEDLIIRGYIKQDGDLFVGVLIDLGLAAQGSSVEEVKAKLYEQVVDYLEEAFSDDAYTVPLLKRKAPLSQQMFYKFAQLAVHWSSLKRYFGQQLDIATPCIPARHHRAA